MKPGEKLFSAGGVFGFCLFWLSLLGLVLFFVFLVLSLFGVSVPHFGWWYAPLLFFAMLIDLLMFIGCFDAANNLMNQEEIIEHEKDIDRHNAEIDERLQALAESGYYYEEEKELLEKKRLGKHWYYVKKYDDVSGFEPELVPYFYFLFVLLLFFFYNYLLLFYI